MHLLVIEDECALCETIVRSLRRLAYSVDCCYDGEKALELLGVERYDLVLLDLNLPGKDGLTVLRTLDGKVPASRLSGYGEDNRITNVTLRNVTILGEKMTNLKQMKLRYDDYCEGIVVE